MKLVSLLAFSGIIYFLGGIGLLFGAPAISGLLDTAVDHSVGLLSQILGAALLGLGWVNWWMRPSGDLIGRKAVTFGNFMFHTVALFILLGPVFGGKFLALGWLLIAGHALFAVAFGYIIFIRRSYCEVRFD
jgi:hypothetical protein